MKHINSIILTLLTALLALPAYAQDFEYQGLTYSIYDEEAKICAVTNGKDSQGDIVIPETVSYGENNYTVAYIGGSCFQGVETVTSVTLPETIVSIHGSAFEQCTGLTSINFPNSITSIGEKAFNSCTSLKEAVLSENISEIGNRAFEYCPALERVVLPSKLAYIDEYTFNTCENLQTIVFNEGLEKIGTGAFSNNAVESLEFPESLTIIDGFSGSTKLKNIKFPTSLPLTIEGWAFRNCTALETISLPENVIIIDGFAGCPSLETVELPNSVTEIAGGAFEGCEKLHSIKFPNNLKKIGPRAFVFCRGLEEIDLPSTLEYIDDSAFADCSGLKSVIIPEGLTTIENNGFAFCSSMTSLSLPASLSKLGGGVFDGCALRTINYNAEIPLEASEDIFYGYNEQYEKAILNMPNATLAEIEAVVPWNKFGHINAKDTYKVPVLENGSEIEYNGIVYVVIDSDKHYVKTRDGNEDDSTAGNSVEGDLVIPSNFIIDNNEYYIVEIGHHGFSSLDLLNSVTIGEGITKISYSAFIYCENLKSVSLPETLTELESDVFNSCKSLMSIELPSGLTEFGGGLMVNCSSLSSVKLPENLSVLPGATFWDCTSLTYIDLPAGLTRIGGNAFWGCSNLGSIGWPESLQYVDEGAFAGTGFVSVEFPEGVLSIDRRVLKYCANLESITLPASLTYLADEAFDENNEKLRTVTYNAEYPIESGDHVFTPYESFKEGVLYTPNALLANVLPYSPWNRFGKIVAKDDTYLMPLEEGENFEYEGIWYTVIDTEAKTCKTREGDPYADPVIPGNTCEGSLNIPAIVTHGSETFSVVEIGSVGFWGNQMTSVNLGNSVINIGWSAFKNCTEMTELNLPNSLVSTGGDSFQGCLGLRSVVLPESLTTLGGSTFSYCANLESVTIPAGLTEFGGDAFVECNKITEVNYLAESPLETGSGFETAVYENAVLNTPHASLADVRATEPWRNFKHIEAKDGSYTQGLPEGEEFEYEGIWYTVINSEEKTLKTKEGHVEGDDEKIPANTISGQLMIPEKITYENNEYTVTEIGYTSFARNLELTSVILPSSVTKITQDAFYGCPELVDIQFSDNLKSIGQGAFYNCEKLESVNLPSSIVTIDWAAFIGCRNIATVNYTASEPISADGGSFDDETYNKATLNTPNATLESIQAVEPWNKFKHIIAKDGSVEPGLAAGEDFEYEGIWYTVLDPDVKTVRTKEAWIDEDQNWVAGNSAIGNLIIPEIVSDGLNDYTVVEIGGEGFIGSGVTSVNLPETVMKIGYSAFKDCRELESIHIPEALQSILSYTFAGCVKLSVINFPEALEALGGEAFSGCESLTSIVLPDNIVSFGGAVFDNCTGLKTVKLPSMLHEIGPSEFRNCKNLESIEIPESLTVISNGMFLGCTNLVEIKFPETLETIEILAFGDCSSLASLDLPSSLKEIQSVAFQGCTALTRVDIPEGVTDLMQDCFEECINISTVSLPSTLTVIEDGVFRYDNNISNVSYLAASPLAADEAVFQDEVYRNATLNMPNATLEAVQSTVPWNKFLRITASDGSVLPAEEGEDFEYEGIIYTVIDSEAKTCKTKEGTWDGAELYMGGNSVEGDLTIPSTVSDGFNDYTVTEIGTYGFANCTTLTSVSIPASVTAISESAFNGCSCLKSIDLPATLEDMHYGAFFGCDPNVEVTYEADTPITADENAFSENAYINGKLNTPNAPLASVQATMPWKKFLRINAADGSVAPAGYGEDFEYDGIIYTVLDPEARTVQTKEGTWVSETYSYIAGNDVEGDLYIPDVVYSGAADYKVVQIGFAGFSGTNVTSIELPNSINTIRSSAFKDCPNLTSINIPEAVTAIGNAAFEDCVSLTSINIPEAMTSISDATFRGCSSLTSLSLPSSINSIGEWAFRDCTSLSSINIPDALTSLSRGMLLNTGITDIHLHDNLTSIGESVFSSCSKLISINLPESITSIGEYAFAGCTSLTEIKLPSAITSLSKGIFQNTGLTTMDIPENVTSIGTVAFSVCSDLSSINIPETVESIGESAFFGCSGLSTLKLPKALKSIERWTFRYCQGLTSIEIPEAVTAIGDSALSVCTHLASLTLPDNLKSIGIGAFDESREIVTVRYNAITPIIAQDNLFENDVYLNGTLNMPNATLADVRATSPWNKFLRINAGDGSLAPAGDGEDFVYNGMTYTVIDAEAKTCKTKDNWYSQTEGISDSMFTSDFEIPSTVSDGIYDYTVVEIGRSTFSNCSTLTSIKLPATLTAIGEYAFDSSGVTSIVVPEGVSEIQFRTFRFCNELTTVQLPSTLTVIGDEAFKQSKKVASVNFPDDLVSIGGYAFNECDALTEVRLPASVVSIGERAFAADFNLTLLELQEGLKAIGAYAFANCGLTSVTIPASVAAFGEMAFAGYYIMEVNYNASTPVEASENLFYSPNEDIYATAILNTPNATLDAVLATTPWNKFLRITASDGSIVPFASEITLSQSSAELKVGGTVTLEATVIPDNATNKTVTWSSDNEDVATVDSNGSVTAISLGEANITATCGPVSATCVVTVVPTPVESVTLSNTSLNLIEGETATLTATIAPADATDQTVTWSSSDDSVATVSENGEVTALKAGTAIITASSSNGMTATCTVTVDVRIIDATDLILSLASAELRVGETVTLEAVVIPEDTTDKTVTWSSDNDNVATVDADGNITAISLGEATIIATCGAVNATCKVTVVETPVESVTLSHSSLELIEGETAILTATIAPVDATDQTVIWTSSDDSVATVSENGEVTALKAGTAVITAISSNWNTADCTVTVAPKIIDATDLTLSLTSAELKVGETLDLEATVIPEDATDKTVIWSSDNDNVAAVDADGRITAISLGEATITATCGSVTATCKVTVVPTPVESVILSNTALNLTEGEIATLTAIVAPADATDQTVTWTSSDASVAAVSESGEVVAVKEGTAIITATSSNGKTATCTVTVASNIIPVTNISISNTELTLIEGDAAMLTATVNPADATDKDVTWTSSDASVVTVSENGEVTAVSAGTAIITASSSNGKTVTCTVTVDAKIIDATDLTLNRTTAELKVGETLALEATVIPADATDKTVTWTSSDASVATVSANGEVVAVKVGTATITAATSNGKTATCFVTVTRNSNDFEYNGLWYTVIDENAKTVKTRAGVYNYEPHTNIAGNNVVGDLTIPAVVSDGLNEYSVVEIGSLAFCDCSELTSINIPESVMTISSNAFDYCSGLTTVNIPESVTSIGSGAFGYCSALTTINIPKSVTSIEHGTFEFCTSLSSINIPESVTSIGYSAFLECSALTSIKLPKGLTSIGMQAFWGCRSLSAIDIPEGINSIKESTFRICSGLTSIKISDNVTEIGENAFAGCSSLTFINIPAGVTSFGEMAFDGCNALISITYHAEVPAAANENIFSNYSQSTLNMPNATLASVQATVPWNKFLRINAADGSIAPVGLGEHFESNGINYTVIDEANRLLQTKNGDPETGVPGNSAEGNLVIPETVIYNGYEYTVTEIGNGSFSGNQNLLSVTIPGSVTNIGTDAFDGCERLTSIVWQGNFPLPMDEISNPNILVYVDDARYAPEWLDHNVVADGVCDNLVLTPGYAFTPVTAFTAEHSEITKSFTQQTPVGGCAGWETLVIPFQPESITVPDGRVLVPFSTFTDIDTQCPFWLYEADAAGEWKEAASIRQGVPYILSMPNNDEYSEQYRIDGEVTFMTDEETLIAPETCAPYATTWNTGREFRSLWLPLTEAEAANAMGLNVGISNLTGDDGQLLAPGSAFHTDVLPKPLEAYVTRIDGRRAMPVRGDQSFVTMIGTEDGLGIAVDLGEIILSSDRDRMVDVFTMDGVAIRHAQVKAGVKYRIQNLTRGIYIVAGRKITVK